MVITKAQNPAIQRPVDKPVQAIYKPAPSSDFIKSPKRRFNLKNIKQQISVPALASNNTTGIFWQQQSVKNSNPMNLKTAETIANSIIEQLSPHCQRIEIAGSIRRRRPDVNDIEIVAIPRAYDTGLFESGIATVVNRWQKVKGELPCKYTQRILPGGEKLDLFLAEPGNWGLIYAIRTGSAQYAHKILATGWVKAGYKSIDGWLHANGKPVTIPAEKELYQRIGIPWVPPEKREIITTTQNTTAFH